MAIVRSTFGSGEWSFIRSRLHYSVDGHAHGRERKSGMGVTFLLSHCRKGVEWCVNRREIVGLVGIAELD